MKLAPLFFLIVALCCSPAFMHAAEPAPATTPATKKADTHNAIRIFNITGGRFAADSMIREIWEYDYREKENPTTHMTISPNEFDDFVLSIEQPPTDAAHAGAMADEILKKLQARLNDEYDAKLSGREMSIEEQWQVARKRLAVAEDKASRTRQMLHEVTGRIDISPQALRQQLSKLEDERQTLQLDKRAKDARSQALAAVIGELSGTVAKKSDTDPAVTELKAVVAAREAQVKITRAMQERGSSPAESVPAAEAAAAEARAKMLERQQEAAAAAGGSQLTKLNEELRTLSIDQAEQRARLEIIGALLDAFSKVSNQIDEYEQLLAEVPNARKAVERAESEHRELERMMSERPRPTVKVIKSTNGEPKPASQQAPAASNPEDSAHSATEK